MPSKVTLDANEAAAYVAYRLNEVIAIYPITPSSPMGEYCDAWSSQGVKNLWGSLPMIQEMQSEGGAAGASHGALQAGALTTSFTASQGLLLMIPNLYKMAGELTSAVLHVTARALASHGLSIFCDHSDVMAVRSTGCGILFAGSVQEAHDFALISQAVSLKARIPFLHVFDGFRTSHEISKIDLLSEDQMRLMIDDELIREHRRRALSPDSPVLRGTAQNPDVFFQSRERANPYYDQAPQIVADAMEKFYTITGRKYKLFDYVGAGDAERVIVAMGSAAETVEQVANFLNDGQEKVGVLKVRLYRPFSTEMFLAALPDTVKAIAVLDRTKEPGSAGEPLLQDIVTALYQIGSRIKVIGGRYGLGSKEVSPGMILAVFEELARENPRQRFTVGIKDDVSNLSLDYDDEFDIEPEETVKAVFWGLGSDGTVSANKNSIKIIGEETDNYAQGYFVYDSKKSGSITVSHLRFGTSPIHAPYLIKKASFIAIHQFNLVDRVSLADIAAPAATVLINSPYGPESVLEHLPQDFKAGLSRKNLRLFVLDAEQLAKQTGMGGRINTIMQTGFFALSGVLPADEAIAKIKGAIAKTYGRFGEQVVSKNCAAVDCALEHLHEVQLNDETLSSEQEGFAAGCNSTHGSSELPPALAGFETTIEMIHGRGDLLPVSAMPADGTFPTGTAKLEKRDIAKEIPVWDPSVCIQCGKCVMVCPHAVIRTKLADEESLSAAPPGFKTQAASWRELKDKRFTLQVSADDCTGCSLCVEICPAKNKSMVGKKAINMVDKQLLELSSERQSWEYFLGLSSSDSQSSLSPSSVKNLQLLEPLFEFSGACAGCGETPYVKLMSQLFGERAVIANATGCSSIYSGNLPTTPWTKNSEGRGPAWSNSLFEDNAEFGLGMRLAIKSQSDYARRLLNELSPRVGSELSQELLDNYESSDREPEPQRKFLASLKAKLAEIDDEKCRDLLVLADLLVKRSVWIIGGDGWAYDIGWGGLDHVLASGENVNILVLDTEVYSNTGGQMSKATARGAVAKFASGGKATAKKDLGRLAMSYGNVYVAQIAMGADDSQTLKAFQEAESYEGTSLIIAYCHCIAHGINMTKGMHQQKLAVQSGHWPLYRFDPRREAEGLPPLQLDCKAPSIALEEYYYSETRYRMLRQTDPVAAAFMLEEAKKDNRKRFLELEKSAGKGLGSEKEQVEVVVDGSKRE